MTSMSEAGRLFRRSTRHFARHPRRHGGFEVHAQQLLLAADDALLQGRPPALRHHQIGFDAARLKQTPNGVSGWFVADRADERTSPAKGGHIQRDVGGTAEPVFAALDLHHRNRRFGRDAIGATVDVPVEHDIAYNQNMDACGRGQLCFHCGNANTRLCRRSRQLPAARPSFMPAFSLEATVRPAAHRLIGAPSGHAAR